MMKLEDMATIGGAIGLVVVIGWMGSCVGCAGRPPADRQAGLRAMEVADAAMAVAAAELDEDDPARARIAALRAYYARVKPTLDMAAAGEHDAAMRSALHGLANEAVRLIGGIEDERLRSRLHAVFVVAKVAVHASGLLNEPTTPAPEVPDPEAGPPAEAVDPGPDVPGGPGLPGAGVRRLVIEGFEVFLGSVSDERMLRELGASSGKPWTLIDGQGHVLAGGG